ncbi:hypothetical protein HmCmsJML077_03245 [Escherichia coli]|nr:hypothetical protein HmCmsJML077_03245 [Escherichia coli]
MMIFRVNIYFKYSTNNNIFILIYCKFCSRTKAPFFFWNGEIFNSLKSLNFVLSFRYKFYNCFFSLLNMIHGKEIEYKFPKSEFKKRLSITSYKVCYIFMGY